MGPIGPLLLCQRPPKPPKKITADFTQTNINMSIFERAGVTVGGGTGALL